MSEGVSRTDVLIGAGIVALLYYLMNGEPLVTFLGILSACIVHTICHSRKKRKREDENNG